MIGSGLEKTVRSGVVEDGEMSGVIRDDSCKVPNVQ